MSIADAIALRSVIVEVRPGLSVELRRPSALDFIDAVQFAERAPAQLYAWLAWRHARNDGGALFTSLEHALDSDGATVRAIGQAAERLYEEGRD